MKTLCLGLTWFSGVLTSPGCSEHRGKRNSYAHSMPIAVLSAHPIFARPGLTSKQEQEPMENSLELLSLSLSQPPFLLPSLPPSLPPSLLPSLLWAYERPWTPNPGTSPLYIASPLLAGALSFPAILSTHQPLTGFGSNHLSLRRPKEAVGMEMIFLSFF